MDCKNKKTNKKKTNKKKKDQTNARIIFIFGLCFVIFVLVIDFFRTEKSHWIENAFIFNWQWRKKLLRRFCSPCVEIHSCSTVYFKIFAIRIVRATATKYGTVCRSANPAFEGHFCGAHVFADYTAFLEANKIPDMYTFSWYPNDSDSKYTLKLQSRLNAK